MDGGYVLKVMVNRWVFNIHTPSVNHERQQPGPLES